MADINYNSGPQNPGYNWKPSGFLAGMSWQQDRDRYMDMAPLQDMMTGMNAQSQAAKLEDYFKDAPVREAERGSKVATANAIAKTIGRQKDVDLETSALTLDFNKRTQESRIGQELLKLPEMQRRQALETVKASVVLGANAANMVKQGVPLPAIAAQLGEQANHPVVQMALTQPEQFNALLKDYTAAEDMLSPSYREKRMEATEREATAAKNRTSSEKIAGMRTSQERESDKLISLAQRAARGDQEAIAMLKFYSVAKGGVGRLDTAEDKERADARSKAIAEYAKALRQWRQLWADGKVFRKPLPPPGVSEQDAEEYFKRNPDVGAPTPPPTAAPGGISGAGTASNPYKFNQ